MTRLEAEAKESPVSSRSEKCRVIAVDVTSLWMTIGAAAQVTDSPPTTSANRQ